MYVFSETTISFVKKAEDLLRQIIKTEINLPVNRSRFEYNKYLYPIHVVVFEGPELGHFNSTYLQIGLNKKLIYLAKESVLKDILRHELAHYMTFIFFGKVQHHGAEFKEVCQRFGFPQEVSAATMNINSANESKVGDLESERVLEKIKKLLKLADSSNPHEAELATLKANQLLLRHHLDHSFLVENNDEIYMDRILVKPRRDAKMEAIYEILKHFIVRPVFSFGKGLCSLEVTGTSTNVKLAHYVANFLDQELDHLWKVTQKETGLSGLRAKNSFFSGVARGFSDKMKQQKEQFTVNEQKALMIIEKNLEEKMSTIYRRLSQSGSSQTIDSNARDAGIKKGRELTIRQGVESKNSNLSISWRK